MECIPISDLLPGYDSQCICVRASRVWYYRGGLGEGEVRDIRMVLVDEQGRSIYATVPPHLVSANTHVIHETGVYRLGSFEVSAQPSLMNPVENPLVLTFTPLTVIQTVLNPGDMFPLWTYRLTSFEDLPSPTETPKRFLDVIGIIRGISDVTTYNISGRKDPTPKREILLADSSGAKIKINLWDEAAWRFNGQVMRFLGQDEAAVVIFVGATIHMCRGSKELAGASSCRWYINEDIEDINVLRAKNEASFEPIKQLHGPLWVNLPSRINDRYPSKTLSELTYQNFLQNQGMLFHCTVNIWRLTPGQPWCVPICAQCRSLATPAASSPAQPDSYTCSNAECNCIAAALEYNLCLLGSDSTGEAEFRLFKKAAQDIVGVSPRQVVLNNYQSTIPITNLAVAAAQIAYTPPEVAAVASFKYEFLIYVANNSFNGSWASFSVHTVQACYPIE